MKKCLATLFAVLFAGLMLASVPQKASAAVTFDTGITAQEIVDDMTVGINIGNSLDCEGTPEDGADTETLWGNPRISEEYIDALVEKGFKTIRIPVTWGSHVDEAGMVDPAWMDRVFEVVDYTYSKGVYVILNSHHDNAFYDLAGINAGTTTLEASCRKMELLWTQISERSESYGERLLFEVMNEPRDTSSDKQWTGGTEKDYVLINALNLASVNAIRATGGNNMYRFIMTPTYCAAMSAAPMKGYEKPNGDDRIIVSLHTYSNQVFEKYNLIVRILARTQIDRAYDYFVSKGTPVVIDEMGWFKNTEIAEKERVKWAKDFTSYAKEKGITCLRWDDNGDFQMFDRRAMTWTHEAEADALIEGAMYPKTVSVTPTFDWWMALCVFAFIILPLAVIALVVFLVVRHQKKKKAKNDR